MKKIPLTQGKFAFVDDEDYKRLMAMGSWMYHRGYAIRSKRVKKNGKWASDVIRMHRLIIDIPDGLEVDHINLNKSDNRRSNLRICTRTENIINRLVQRNNSSGFKGVVWHKRIEKFQARIGVGKKRLHLGYFDNALDAAKAYNNSAKQYHGQFSILNEI